MRSGNVIFQKEQNRPKLPAAPAPVNRAHPPSRFRALRLGVFFNTPKSTGSVSMRQNPGLGPSGKLEDGSN
jgi:hypothetical protein